MPISKIQITPAWTFTDENGGQLDPQLLPLLRALHKHGKLTAAAKQVGMSYRHGWNLLNKWSAFFGHPLVELHKGRGSNLTPLGEKLVWADQRIKARLGPELDNLASELKLALQQTLSDMNPVLRIHASHGFAVALLPKFSDDLLQLDLQYKSAVDALAALAREDCDIAGFHVPADGSHTVQVRKYSHYLKAGTQRIIGFITRSQGLMVRPGNPKHIQGLDDLTRPDVRFINRQHSSGTRALLDALLRQGQVPANEISGFEQEEYTHSAVAAYVAAEMADVGFGVEAAARQFGLDFIPIALERYLLACAQRSLEQKLMRDFLTMIRSEEFQDEVRKLPGYTPVKCGDILSVEEALPRALNQGP